jgi:alpha-tubulin suppressor-like RCC1 family protein
VGNNVGHVPYETQPTEVTSVAGATPLTYVSVSAGDQATCALDDQHYALCWGYNVPTGALGLGVGTLSPIYSPMAVDIANSPSGTATYSSLAVSDSASASDLSHMCALTINQYPQIYCWGNNASGELGINTVGGVVRFPVQFVGSGVTAPLPEGVLIAAVAIGGQYSCAMPIPNQMNIGNGVYCWGDDSRGQLGFTGSGGPAPKFVQGSATFQSFSVGYDSACGWDASGTEPNTYCWGNDTSGQLGIGSSGGYSGIGQEPITVVAGHHFTMVSVGVDYACGIVTDYSYSISAARGYAQLPYCWGANNMGQLGDGNMNESPTPVLALKHP